MISTILTVCRKEVVENSRDWRTLFSTIFFGPLLGPVLFGVFITVMVSQVLSGTDEAIEVPIIGQSHAPNLVEFLVSQGVEPTSELESLEEAVSSVTAGLIEFALVIDPEFAERFRAGSDARVTLVFDQSTAGANLDMRRVQGLLEGYAQQLRLMRIQARGINPLVLRPFTIDEYDVSTATGRSVIVLGVLTYFLLIASLMGGFYLAIDTTAGERDRGSLEPLLTTPVTRSALLLGKMTATVCYMSLSLMLTVGGFAVALNLVPLEELGMQSNFGFGVALTVALILLPFIPFGAALMTLVASFTRSYKEAQTYLSLVLLVPILPLIVSTFVTIRPGIGLMCVPGLSQHLLILELLKANPINPMHLALSIGCSLSIGLLLAWLATRLYQRESLLA